MNQNANSNSTKLIVGLIAGVGAGVLISILVLGMLRPNRNVPPPSTPVSSPAVTVVSPKATNPSNRELDGKWEVTNRAGHLENNSVLPTSIGSQIEFLSGGNAKAFGGVMQYLFVDSSHLKIVEGDGSASIYEYSRSANTITLKDGAFSFTLEPFVILEVTQANLAGTWRFNDTYASPDCIYVPTQYGNGVNPQIIKFMADNTMVIFQREGIDRAGEQWLGNYQIEGDLLTMAANGNGYVDGFSTACRVQLLTKTRLDLVHRDHMGGDYNEYLRAGDNAAPQVLPTITPSVTPWPTSAPLPILTPGPDIVLGTWLQQQGISGLYGNVIISLHSDGTVQIKGEVPNFDKLPIEYIENTYQGSYLVQGNLLIITLDQPLPEGQKDVTIRIDEMTQEYILFGDNAWTRLDVIVTNVVPGSPAAQAGIQPGDQLAQIDDTAVAVGSQVVEITMQHKPGDTVSVTVVRLGQQLVFKIMLGTYPGDDQRAWLGVGFSR